MQVQFIKQEINRNYQLTKRSCMPQTILFSRKNGQVTFQPNIGLDASIRQSVVDMLNLLLADEAVLLLKMCQTDGHADVMGISELQSLYDAQCKQINVISNEIIERVQILGGTTLKDSETLTDSSRLGREINLVSGIVSVLADQEAFIRFLREDAQKCSEIYEDQGTFALLVSVLGTHEKMAWMLRSYIEPELPHGRETTSLI
jgi:starvation-inducible DNA-binding protein